jgi:hypothetical protein
VRALRASWAFCAMCLSMRHTSNTRDLTPKQDCDECTNSGFNRPSSHRSRPSIRRPHATHPTAHAHRNVHPGPISWISVEFISEKTIALSGSEIIVTTAPNNEPAIKMLGLFQLPKHQQGVHEVDCYEQALATHGDDGQSVYDALEPLDEAPNEYREASRKMLGFLHGIFDFLLVAHSEKELQIRVWAVAAALGHEVINGDSHR